MYFRAVYINSRYLVESVNKLKRLLIAISVVVELRHTIPQESELVPECAQAILLFQCYHTPEEISPFKICIYLLLVIIAVDENRSPDDCQADCEKDFPSS